MHLFNCFIAHAKDSHDIQSKSIEKEIEIEIEIARSLKHRDYEHETGECTRWLCFVNF